jgi:hypothetical protein
MELLGGFLWWNAKNHYGHAHPAIIGPLPEKNMHPGGGTIPTGMATALPLQHAWPQAIPMRSTSSLHGFVVHAPAGAQGLLTGLVQLCFERRQLLAVLSGGDTAKQRALLAQHSGNLGRHRLLVTLKDRARPSCE